LKTTKIAILAEEPFFWGSRKQYHKIILDNYCWKKNNRNYSFSACYLYDKDILKDRLNTKKFDVFLIPGGGVGNNEALVKGIKIFYKNKLFKQKIRKFVLNGGGIIGICGGAALITDITVADGKKPSTIIERLYHNSSLEISCVSSYFHSLAFPLLYPFQYNHPEKIGNSAYAFGFGPGFTSNGKSIHSIGLSLDINVNKKNPIFFDYSPKTRRIRWWAGQSLVIPKNPNRTLDILGRFPSKDISKNEQMKLFAWKYTGGISGILHSYCRSCKMVKKYNLPMKTLPLFCYYLAGNWKKTDKIIELDTANKPCMTAEIYPNEFGGRILLSTVHPEYLIWYGGHIKEKTDKDFNNIGSGFFRWEDINPLSDTLQDELTHNWWILRRMVAWAGKVPKEDMPPIDMGVINEEVQQSIIKNIYWDGSFIQQLRNI